MWAIGGAVGLKVIVCSWEFGQMKGFKRVEVTPWAKTRRWCENRVPNSRRHYPEVYSSMSKWRIYTPTKPTAGLPGQETWCTCSRLLRVSTAKARLVPFGEDQRVFLCNPLIRHILGPWWPKSWSRCERKPTCRDHRSLCGDRSQNQHGKGGPNASKSVYRPVTLEDLVEKTPSLLSVWRMVGTGFLAIFSEA